MGEVLAFCEALGVDAGEFAKEPTTRYEPRRGRPPKGAPEPAVKQLRKGT